MPDWGHYVRSATPRKEGVATVTAVIHSKFDRKKAFRVMLFQQDENGVELTPQLKIVEVLPGYPQPVHFDTSAHTCHFQITAPHSELAGDKVNLLEVTLGSRDA
jgi:hypothetical protein